eukprot:399148_1
MAQEESASESEEIDYNTNLLSLGADAWDDSALVEAFNKDLKFYKQSHKNQLIDLSKVSNMINFKKAEKINQTITNKINEEQEETGYEDQDDDDDDDDDDNDTKTDTILAPSFIPFANKNVSKQNKINKYSSWPPQKINTNNKKSKRKQKRNKKHMNNDNEFIETENLAKMYEEQQQREQQNQQYMYPQYGYTQQQPYGYYNQYGQQPNYYYGQQQQQQQQQQPMYSSYPSVPPQMQHMPHMPPMPPYAQSRTFNMGLNMMGQPHMSKKPNRDEALANMLLAWYWNGYYAGYQAGMEHKQ